MQSNSELPATWKRQGNKKKIQGQWKVRELYKVVREIIDTKKDREKSGNFMILALVVAGLIVHFKGLKMLLFFSLFAGLMLLTIIIKWAPTSEFVSSSIPSWQISTSHAQPFRGARDLAFCLKVPLDSLLVWASSEGSGETARMRRLAWTFAARIGDKYQIRLTRSK